MSEDHRRGCIEVVHGSMFSGKTQHMIARLRQERAAGRRVAAFKHAIDDRYAPDYLVTHQDDRFEARRVPSAEAILDFVADADVVAVDEGHFFGLGLLSVAQKLAAMGKSVYVAGISNDSWGRPFEPMPQLCAIADNVITLQSPCRVCGEPSPFSQRMTAIGTLHMVGGVDDYEPRCAEHFTPSSEPPEER